MAYGHWATPSPALVVCWAWVFLSAGQGGRLGVGRSRGCADGRRAEQLGGDQLVGGLADAGSLPVRAAIGGVLGSNIGTVTTTLLAGIPSGPIARKTALLDLLFNTVGVAFVAPLLGAFPAWMAVITEFPGRQVANAHTLFNLVTVALALPWVGPISRIGPRRSRLRSGKRGSPP